MLVIPSTGKIFPIRFVKNQNVINIDIRPRHRSITYWLKNFLVPITVTDFKSFSFFIIKKLKR